MNRPRISSTDQLTFLIPANGGAAGPCGFRKAVRNAWKEKDSLLRAEKRGAPAAFQRLLAIGDLILTPMLALAVVFTAIADRGLAARWNEYEQEIAAGREEG